MAVDVDSSSPPTVTFNANSSRATASFTPPAGALLVAFIGTEFTGPPALSNSGTGFTWTQRKIYNLGLGGDDGEASIYTAPVSVSQSMTVTATYGFNNYGGLRVLVITGHDAASPIGQTGAGTSTTNNINPTVYTSSAAGSRAFGVANDWRQQGTPATTDVSGGTYDVGGHVSGIVAYKAAATPSSGSGVSLNFDGGGTGATAWNWVAIEIKPGPEPVIPRAYVSRAAVHRSASW